MIIAKKYTNIAIIIQIGHRIAPKERCAASSQTPHIRIDKQNVGLALFATTKGMV